MAQRGYLTNLASEFYILSLLSRLGLDASLTLGNKKQIDIVVVNDEGNSITIDVKAVASKNDWILGNSTPKASENHFIFLVGYEGNFKDPNTLPRVWIIPSNELHKHILITDSSKMHFISRKTFIENGKHFENAWHLLNLDNKSLSITQ